MTSAAPPVTLSSTAAPGEARTATTVKHLAGLLWDEMLTALNQTGLSSDSLGIGGDSYQSMFMWDISQNDTGKYDGTLVAAAMRQLGAQTDAGAGAGTGAGVNADTKAADALVSGG